MMKKTAYLDVVDPKRNARVTLDLKEVAAYILMCQLLPDS